jgi:dipeptidase E
MINTICAVIGGSGSAAFAEPSVAALVVRAASRSRARFHRPPVNEQSPLRVAYLGTATYDDRSARERQTGELARLGCRVVSIDVAWPPRAPLDADASAALRRRLRECIEKSDVVLVSGGNTLFAFRRWRELGIDEALRDAATHLGVVIAGGSAGAITLFDGGHSDSGDPDTFRPKRRPQSTASAPSASTGSDGYSGVDGNAPFAEEEALVDVVDSAGANVEARAEAQAPGSSSWEYMRVASLGLLPGLLCPHHDRTQSNGVPRHEDFNRMLLKHPGERGVAIDHWCVLVVDCGEYELFGVPGMVGSVVAPDAAPPLDADAPPFIDGAEFDAVSGVPGVWVKDVVAAGADARIEQRAIARRGWLSNWLKPATAIQLDTATEDAVWRRNPTTA